MKNNSAIIIFFTFIFLLIDLMNSLPYLRSNIRKLDYDDPMTDLNDYTHIPIDPYDTDDIDNDGERETEICSVEEIIGNKCGNRYMSWTQIDEVKDFLLRGSNNNKIIITQNIVIQFSTIQSQLESNLETLSSIDFGSCEATLKQKNGIPQTESLLLFKADITTEDNQTPYVLYKVFRQGSTVPLNLNDCTNKIIINTPVYFDDKMEKIYKSLTSENIDIFNTKEDFYQDICFKYTTIDDTDITINDRRKLYFKPNEKIYMCQKECKLDSYNYDTNKAKCICTISTKNANSLSEYELFEKRNINKDFYDKVKDINFKVMKCADEVFDSDYKENIGSFILIALTALVIGFNVFSIITCQKKINFWINVILRRPFNNIAERPFENQERDPNKNMMDNNNIQKIEFKEDIYNIKKDNNENIDKKDEQLILNLNKNSENIGNKDIKLSQENKENIINNENILNNKGNEENNDVQENIDVKENNDAKENIEVKENIDNKENIDVKENNEQNLIEENKDIIENQEKQEIPLNNDNDNININENENLNNNENKEENMNLNLGEEPNNDNNNINNNKINEENKIDNNIIENNNKDAENNNIIENENNNAENDNNLIENNDNNLKNDIIEEKNNNEINNNEIKNNEINNNEINNNENMENNENKINENNNNSINNQNLIDEDNKNTDIKNSEVTVKKKKTKKKKKKKKKGEGEEDEDNLFEPPKKTRSSQKNSNSLNQSENSQQKILNDYNKNGRNNNGKINMKNIDAYNSSAKERKSGEKLDEDDKRTEILENEDSINNLSNYELDNLDYKQALELDKRTYLAYYWSLCKRKQLILFAFWPENDLNIFTMKIATFIACIGFCFGFNGFFYGEKLLHKIYKDKGTYKFAKHLPYMIYSTIVAGLLSYLVRLLTLSENEMYKMKQNKENKNDSEQKTKKWIKIKFIIFFVVTIVLMLFFWYFITCFCGIFTNTQVHWIIDSCITFGFCMVYPFILNLLPGAFRIPALRAKNKDQSLLYKISLYVAYI